MNHWTEDTDKLWKTQLVTMIKKKNGKLTMRGFRPIAMLPTIYRLYSEMLQQVAGGALQSRRGPQRGPQYGHVPGRQASRSGLDAQTGGGTGYGVANSGLRDGLRCGTGV